MHFAASWSTRRAKQEYGVIQLVSEPKTDFGGFFFFLANSLEFQGLTVATHGIRAKCLNWQCKI